MVAHSRHEPSSTIPPSPPWERFRATLEPFTKQIAMSHQIHTYSELRQQIHDDLRMQHPNGSSQMASPLSAIRTSHVLWNY